MTIVLYLLGLPPFSPNSNPYFLLQIGCQTISNVNYKKWITKIDVKWRMSIKSEGSSAATIILLK
jgi:hypothetical protein